MAVEGALDPVADGEFARVMTGAKAGEAWALGVLFRESNPALIRFLRARASTEAEDLASDVWLTAAGGLTAFVGGRSQWRAWLFTLAHRRLVDHQRRSIRRRTDPAPPDAFDEAAGGEDPGYSVVEAVSAQAAVDRLVANLTPEQAEVVLLRVVGGFGADEVAAIMGRAPGWVRVTQHRALRRMKEAARADEGIAP